MPRPSALVADDEPLLRDALVRQLATTWPELEVVAQARNGREAIRQFDARHPDVCFLDVQMPGIDGVTVARHIGRRAHIVFVTAFDEYAVQAFAHGAIDYLLKPVEPARLADTVARLRERLRASEPAAATDGLLQEIAERLQVRGGSGPLRWIRAQSGPTLRMIAVDDVDYLRSDHKHTLVAWRDEAGNPVEALVRTPLKELLAGLDSAQFVQIHRSVVVNLRSVRQVRRGGGETAEVQLKGRPELLPVSRTFLHVFRGM
jgi:DNA-binding LytR/AlgR family response regulator